MDTSSGIPYLCNKGRTRKKQTAVFSSQKCQKKPDIFWWGIHQRASDGLVENWNVFPKSVFLETELSFRKARQKNFSVFSLAVDEMPSSWSSWKWWPQFVKWWRNYEWTNPQLSTADILKTWQLTETAPNMQDSLFNRIFSTSAVLLIRPERGLNNTLRVWHDSSASGSLWIRVNVKLRTV